MFCSKEEFPACLIDCATRLYCLKTEQFEWYTKSILKVWRAIGDGRIMWTGSRQITVLTQRMTRLTAGSASSGVRWAAGKKTIMAKHKSKKVKDKFPGPFVEMMHDWSKYLLLVSEDYQNTMSEVISRGSENALNTGYALGPVNVLSSTHDPVNRRSEVEFEIKTPNPLVRNVFTPRSLVSLCEGDSMEQMMRGKIKQSTVSRIVVSLPGECSDLVGRSLLLRPFHEASSIDSVYEFIQKDLNPTLACKAVIDMTFRATVIPSVHHDPPITALRPLNESQRRAVTAALNPKRPFVCIQGPPGTGKTDVVVEIIQQAIKKKRKVLVVAQTHAALNEMMQRLEAAAGADSFVSIEFIDERNDQTDSLDDEIEKFLLDKSMGVRTSWKHDEKMRRKMRKEKLAATHVVFSTTSNAFIRSLPFIYNWSPSMVLVDEAGQVTEPSTWISAAHAPRVILAGDPKQLPPFVLGPDVKDTLKTSLLERLMKDFATSNCSFLLDVQFRMNKKIMQWSNEQFYDNRLSAHPFVEGHTLRDLCPQIPDALNEPMMFVDTDTVAKSGEKTVHNSYRNEGEASLIVNHIKRLLAYGLSQDAIGVISPYFAQTAYIRMLLAAYPGIVVNTVDAFQGNQKEVILFSMVRKNKRGDMGFVADARRLNVAVTRARRQFVLFGSGEMIKRSRGIVRSLRAHLAPYREWSTKERTSAAR